MERKIENIISVMECIENEWKNDESSAMTLDELSHLIMDMREIQEDFTELSDGLKYLASSL